MYTQVKAEAVSYQGKPSVAVHFTDMREHVSLHNLDANNRSKVDQFKI